MNRKGFESNIHQAQFTGFRFIRAAAALGIGAGLLEALIQWGRLLVGVPEPMGPEILWAAPAVYGLLAGLLAALLVLLFFLVERFRALPNQVKNWLALLSLGLILFLGIYNALSIVISTSRAAGIILTAGLFYQAAWFLMSRKNGALGALSRMTPWAAGLTIVLFVLVNGGKFAREKVFLASLPAARAAAPNVLLITLDTLRADRLSTYGYHRPTPNLDEFAREGLQFDYAFATSAWTLPSHATIMTGLFTYEHRAEMMTGGRLDDKFLTLAEAFSQSGYATAAFVANEFAATANLGFGQGFSHFNDLFWNVEDVISLTRLGTKLDFILRTSPAFQWHQLGRKNAAEVNREFTAWLGEGRTRPFFVWLNYFDPHDPYSVPRDFPIQYGDKPVRGDPGSFGAVGASDWGGTLDPEETRWQSDAYDTTVAYLDAQIGVLLETLRRQSLYDNTIIVITSDHGEAFGEHGLYGHANSLYREEINVPLLIRYPASIQAGRHVGQPVSLRDLPATIVALANIAPQYKFPGLRLDIDARRAPAIAELYRNPYQPASHPVSQGDLTSISSDQWHGIFSNGKAELYARDDHNDQVNLSGSQEGKQALATLKNQLQEILALKLPQAQILPKEIGLIWNGLYGH